MLDRRKDLYHNAFGRRLADDAKNMNLSSQQLLTRILAEVEKEKTFIPHYNDPRVEKLKTESEMGCPGLPDEISLYPRF